MAKKFKHLSPNSAEFLHEFRRLLAERPEISDEEFMRETEAPVGTDGEYLYGPGVLLIPQSEAPTSTTPKLAEESLVYDFDWDESLFRNWYHDRITPDTIPRGSEEMQRAYSAWFERVSQEEE